MWGWAAAMLGERFHDCNSNKSQNAVRVQEEQWVIVIRHLSKKFFPLTRTFYFLLRLESFRGLLFPILLRILNQNPKKPTTTYYSFLLWKMKREIRRAPSNRNRNSRGEKASAHTNAHTVLPIILYLYIFVSFPFLCLSSSHHIPATATNHYPQNHVWTWTTVHVTLRVQNWIWKKWTRNGTKAGLYNKYNPTSSPSLVRRDT